MILPFFDIKMIFQVLTFPCTNITKLVIHVCCTVEINKFVSKTCLLCDACHCYVFVFVK